MLERGAAVMQKRVRFTVLALCLVVGALFVATNVDNATGAVGDENVDLSPPSTLPTGSLEKLRAQLKDVIAKEEAAKQKVTDSDNLEQQAMDTLVTEGKQVSSTVQQSKLDKTNAEENSRQAAQEEKMFKHFTKEAADDAKQAKEIAANLAESISTDKANEAKRAALEAPIQSNLDQIDANDLQFKKDSMDLAEKETTISHITDSKTLAAAKASLSTELKQVQAESKARRGLESRVQQLQALSAKLPVMDAGQLESETLQSNEQQQEFQSKSESASAEAADAKEQVDALNSKAAALDTDAATTMKLAQNEQKELSTEMVQRQEARQEHLKALKAYREIHHERVQLQEAIALLEPNQDSDSTVMPHTIPADAVDRAAAFADPQGGDGPLTAEVEAQKAHRALQKKIKDAERLHAEEGERPNVAPVPSGGGGGVGGGGDGGGVGAAV